MIDYEIFYKSKLPLQEEWEKTNQWDTFISAYEPAERVQQVYAKAKAARKHWLILPEYEYTKGDLPSQEYYENPSEDEAEYIKSFWGKYYDDFHLKSICVDITGFIRPYLLFLVRWLMDKGVRRFDAIYSEPKYYRRREHTVFSGEAVTEVRQVAGFEGRHVIDTSNDVIIINSGYEDQLIQSAAEHKDQAKKIQILGFPSLRADMFQENMLRAHIAEEAVGSRTSDVTNTYFAPANDPFITASAVQAIVNEQNSRRQITNLYLCPIATKAQSLGFALYYLNEWRNKPASIIYPFSDSYAKETTTGLSRIWKYSIELPTT